MDKSDDAINNLIDDKPDYVRAMSRITRFTTEGRCFKLDSNLDCSSEESMSSESELEEELPPPPLSAEQIRQQQQDHPYERALFEGVVHVQTHAVPLPPLSRDQARTLLKLRTPIRELPVPPRRPAAAAAAANVQNSSEKSLSDSCPGLERYFDDEDYLLIKRERSPKNLTDLGQVLHSSSTPRGRRSIRGLRKTESDEPNGIVLYLQPINHDLSFKTNSTIDKSTQI